MLAVSAFFMGKFSLFAYLRPFLKAVAHAGPITTSLMLGAGAAGLAGTVLIGSLLKDHLYRALNVIALLMAAAAALLIGFGSSVPTTALLLGAGGLLGTSAPVAWWTWVARSLPDGAEAGGDPMVAVVQLAIALGAAVGGILFDAAGYASPSAPARHCWPRQRYWR